MINDHGAKNRSPVKTALLFQTKEIYERFKFQLITDFTSNALVNSKQRVCFTLTEEKS